MTEALAWLDAHGIRVTRPTAWQLKIGPYNYYPDKGTIHRDGDRQPHPERGLPALQQLLHPFLEAEMAQPVLRPANRR
jgi:hypothetical protein